MSVGIGATAKGVVLKVLDYGAIVRLPDGQSGLVHISQIADTYVRDVHEHLNEGDEVCVKVLGIDPKGRYQLSIKQGNGASVAADRGNGGAARRASPRPDQGAGPGPTLATSPSRSLSFEDRLSRFRKDSEERQQDLRRHLDGKRGRR